MADTADAARGPWWLPPLAVAVAAVVVWVPLELDARRYRRRLERLEQAATGDERRVRDELYPKDGHRG